MFEFIITEMRLYLNSFNYILS